MDRQEIPNHAASELSFNYPLSRLLSRKNGMFDGDFFQRNDVKPETWRMSKRGPGEERGVFAAERKGTEVERQQGTRHAPEGKIYSIWPNQRGWVAAMRFPLQLKSLASFHHLGSLYQGYKTYKEHPRLPPPPAADGNSHCTSQNCGWRT